MVAGSALYVQRTLPTRADFVPESGASGVLARGTFDLSATTTAYFDANFSKNKTEQVGSPSFVPSSQIDYSNGATITIISFCRLAIRTTQRVRNAFCNIHSLSSVAAMHRLTQTPGALPVA